ncbi:DinB family protein [Rossellomorea aquimaris]|uniref:DinB family protein n=1 Tax=Rossellomorea aquimaris TaxID=189382 RepID=UPI001CD24F0E|nr:DinB family protein [Rossellomorea aquimaris]MCA1057659.1 DinB family protein [Rossellomorea aquimaris]
MEYKVTELQGFTYQIGHLVSQMDYVRKTTIDAVKGLTIEELDFLPSDDSNSIGALLLHIAAIEKGFQIEIFDGRKPNQQEIAQWGDPYSLGDKGRKNIKGNSLDFYITKLKDVRQKTLEEFAKQNDTWLYENRLWDNQQSNHYFIWFHVFEDEINHRGQIRLIKKMLSKS